MPLPRRPETASPDFVNRNPHRVEASDPEKQGSTRRLAEPCCGRATQSEDAPTVAGSCREPAAHARSRDGAVVTTCGVAFPAFPHRTETATNCYVDVEARVVRPKNGKAIEHLGALRCSCARYRRQYLSKFAGYDRYRHLFTAVLSLRLSCNQWVGGPNPQVHGIKAKS
jgi:hypothetical protein